MRLYKLGGIVIADGLSLLPIGCDVEAPQQPSKLETTVAQAQVIPEQKPVIKSEGIDKKVESYQNVEVTSSNPKRDINEREPADVLHLYWERGRKKDKQGVFELTLDGGEKEKNFRETREQYLWGIIENEQGKIVKTEYFADGEARVLIEQLTPRPEHGVL